MSGLAECKINLDLPASRSMRYMNAAYVLELSLSILCHVILLEFPITKNV